MADSKGSGKRHTTVMGIYHSTKKANVTRVQAVIRLSEADRVALGEHTHLTVEGTAVAGFLLRPPHGDGEMSYAYNPEKGSVSLESAVAGELGLRMDTPVRATALSTEQRADGIWVAGVPKVLTSDEVSPEAPRRLGHRNSAPRAQPATRRTTKARGIPSAAFRRDGDDVVLAVSKPIGLFQTSFEREGDELVLRRGLPGAKGNASFRRGDGKERLLRLPAEPLGLAGGLWDEEKRFRLRRDGDSFRLNLPTPAITESCSVLSTERIPAATETTGNDNNSADGENKPELNKRWFEEADAFQGTQLVRRGRPKSDTVKQPVTIRLDSDLVELLKRSGDGWQTRMNESLRKSFLGDELQQGTNDQQLIEAIALVNRAVDERPALQLRIQDGLLRAMEQVTSWREIV